LAQTRRKIWSPLLASRNGFKLARIPNRPRQWLDSRDVSRTNNAPQRREFGLHQVCRIETQRCCVYTFETMGAIFVGTSGWAYPSWKRGFYPRDLSSAKFLNYYATRLNSVEVNHTFLRPVTKQAVKEWIDSTPADFVFAVKAPQSITHFRRLRAAKRQTSSFFRSIESLRAAGKLGPVLFQLPPNFKCDPARLKNFLLTLPSQTRLAFEFRHPSWFNEEVYALLQSANAALCLAESDKLETPRVQTADFAYFRLRKSSYTAEMRRELTKQIHTDARRGDVFVYFKHEETPESALHGEELLHALRGNESTSALQTRSASAK
jgi:uncharacterized protein YecE (DUF72 family)